MNDYKPLTCLGVALKRRRGNADRRRFKQLLGGVFVALALSVTSAIAEQSKPFPDHWGEPPPIQTRDYVEWPGGYGHGSGSVAKWITMKMEKDQADAGDGPSVIYTASFEGVEEGALPDDFMALNGDFAVKAENGKQWMEAPGAPLESFVVLFGPAAKENHVVSARIQGTRKGRLYPVFAVGLNGIGGYRLRVTPAKRALELFRGPEEGGEIVASAPFKWQAGKWTNLKLQVRRDDDGQWRVDGKAWMEGESEPKGWMVLYVDEKEPYAGRPSVWASPYSGTPIRFDDLVVAEAGEL